MTPKEEVNRHIQDVLNDLADVILDISAKERFHELRFTEEDVINASIIFSNICSSYAYHNNSVPFKKALKRAEYFGTEMHSLIKTLCGLDMKKYIKEQ